MLKNIGLVVNSLALAGSLLWTFFQFGYEPVITSLVLIATLIGLVVSKNKETKSENNQKTEINITNNVGSSNSINPKSSYSTNEDLERRKKLTRVLFVDDDTKFKIIKILNKAGWNTRIVKDIENIDSELIHDSHILFIDIQGVGLKLDFKDQGLGLAFALKKKYPSKKVIIYSTESKGDRFHEALRTVDTFLSKNAEPFEFQELIEQYSAEVNL